MRVRVRECVSVSTCVSSALLSLTHTHTLSLSLSRSLSLSPFSLQSPFHLRCRACRDSRFTCDGGVFRFAAAGASRRRWLVRITQTSATVTKAGWLWSQPLSFTTWTTSTLPSSSRPRIAGRACVHVCARACVYICVTLPMIYCSPHPHPFSSSLFPSLLPNTHTQTHTHTHTHAHNQTPRVICTVQVYTLVQ